MMSAARSANLLMGLLVVLASVLVDRITTGAPGFGVTQQLMLGTGAGLSLVGFLPAVWNRRILLLILTLGVSIAAGEGALRASVGPYYAAVYEFDNDAIYKLRPNANKIYRRSPVDGGESIVVRTNSDGFRDAEPSTCTAHSAKRVAVYGDSFIESEFSSIERTFVTRLGIHLGRELGSPVCTVNAGVSGYGPDQEYMRIARELPALSPDLLVVAVYAGNDFGDLLRNKMFRLADDGSLLKNAWELSPHLKTKLAGFDILLASLVERRWPHLTSANDVTSLSGPSGPRAWLEYQRTDYENYVRQGNNVVNNLSADYPDIDMSVEPDSHAVKYKTGLMRGVLSTIERTAATHRVPLLFVIIPSPEGVCRRCEGVLKGTVEFPGFRGAATAEIAEDLIRDLHVPFINLLERFKPSDPDTLYFKHDTHWNDTGQDVAARMVSHYITTTGILR